MGKRWFRLDGDTWKPTKPMRHCFSDRGVMRFQLARSETENPVRQVALSDSIIVSQNTSPKTIDSLQVSVDIDDLWVDVHTRKELQWEHRMSRARVVERPFFDPPRRRAVPAASA